VPHLYSFNEFSVSRHFHRASRQFSHFIDFLEPPSPFSADASAYFRSNSNITNSLQNAIRENDDC